MNVKNVLGKDAIPSIDDLEVGEAFGPTTVFLGADPGEDIMGTQTPGSLSWVAS
ncbi:hypothetical protein ACFQJ7_09520 [Halovenus rubra]|uniref:Uncharacterized protein n=2 Tax=Halovenus rubra TaxID=869890 RepID=A0ABD5X8Q7_9EURY|nr:hypothetical protein [Halovenus rubra]